MKTLLLIRGLPGCGQESLAKRICYLSGAERFEADGSTVRWDSRRLEDIQRQTYHCALHAANSNDVVVSGTFIARRHVMPYVRAAREGRFDLFIKECMDVNLDESAPAYVMKWMRANYWHSQEEPGLKYYV